MPNINTGGSGGSGAASAQTVLTTRQISTQSPLEGGGDFSQDRTHSINTATFAMIGESKSWTASQTYTKPQYFFGVVNRGAQQVSGVDIHYGPIFQRQQTAAQRYLVSGEMAGAFAATNFAIRNQPNWFTGTHNVFGPSTAVTISGQATLLGGVLISGTTVHFNPVYHRADRYLPSGEFPNFARRDAENYFSAANFFASAITASGGIESRALARSWVSSTDPAFWARQDSTGKAIYAERSIAASQPLVDIQQQGRFDSQPGLQLTSAASGIAVNYVQAFVDDFSEEDVDQAFAIYWNGSFQTLGNATVSGTTVHYRPVYNRTMTGPDRYITSGELSASAGTGDAIKAQPNFWTGTQNVFSAGTNVTVSGELRIAGGTNGSFLAVRSQERLVTLSGTGTVMVTGMLTGAVLAVTWFNSTAISGGGAGFKGVMLGVSGYGYPYENLFGGPFSGAQGTSATYAQWNLSQIPVFSAPTPVQVLASGGPPFAGGKGRLTTYYMEVIAPNA